MQVGAESSLAVRLFGGCLMDTCRTALGVLTLNESTVNGIVASLEPLLARLKNRAKVDEYV